MTLIPLSPEDTARHRRPGAAAREPAPDATVTAPDAPVPAPDAPVPAPAPDATAPARLDRESAEALGERIQHHAALIAAATCELLLMVAEFEARGGVGWFVGLKSTAHWLAWSCSMSPGAAREHVRVARALPSMPLTVEEFRAGRLSYSKVREMTRVVDRVDEEVLVEMARAMTAAQLALAIAGFRAVDGARLGQDAVRRAEWSVRDDGMVEIRAVLPAELGAEVTTALELAMDRDGSAPPASSHRVPPPADGSVPETERAAEVTTAATLEQRRADALHDLARTYLHTEPVDRSGEDRHLVVVQVSAEALHRDVPAGTPEHRASHVPAGTPPHCGVLGAGPLEVTTADRLACTGKVSLLLTDADGEILHLGRSRRLASRAQRRALRLRDTTCAFPGCHQAKHLDAHHLIPWSEGGVTDIDGLALLCRRHHVMVHEGGLRLVRDTGRSSPPHPRFHVLDGAGRPVQARWPALRETLRLREDPATGPPPQPQEEPDGAAATPGRAPDPARIAPTTGGAGFRLADCIDALCASVLPPAGGGRASATC